MHAACSDTNIAGDLTLQSYLTRSLQNSIQVSQCVRYMTPSVVAVGRRVRGGPPFRLPEARATLAMMQ